MLSHRKLDDAKRLVHCRQNSSTAIVRRPRLAFSFCRSTQPELHWNNAPTRRSPGQFVPSVRPCSWLRWFC